MKIVMVKKIMEDGQECKKCREVSERLKQNDEMQYSILDVMSDPILVVITSRLFWDSINLAQAEMTYKEDTPQLKYWSDRVEISKKLFMHHLADNEKGYASDLLATLRYGWLPGEGLRRGLRRADEGSNFWLIDDDYLSEDSPQ